MFSNGGIVIAEYVSSNGGMVILEYISLAAAGPFSGRTVLSWKGPDASPNGNVGTDDDCGYPPPDPEEDEATDVEAVDPEGIGYGVNLLEPFVVSPASAIAWV